ncbi:hypothetical protein RND71_043861 [Anisodus tanguticus]|uniref:Splicing factor 3A subunit 1 n=1 Tax=Anisodus tanguticus TaxID=243964 RepID=A0AAE1UTP0_9SOLA|nr:hypothetical protein RND71_043861 [Anisodus tanguticus]
MTNLNNAPIIPPPDLRNIVDKTASFVARNGPEFESRIQQNEQNNPKFNFLKPGDPYNAYYQFKVKEIKEGTISSTITNGSVLKTTNAQGVISQVPSKIKNFIEKSTLIPQEPPPEFEFIIEPPTILSQDLDIIKLTAQFVAIHGRSFLTNLMNKEQRNYQFDFLKPQHGLFNYFTQLIEQYSKIFNQAKNTLEELKKELEPDVIMNKVRYRLEWTKIKEAEKRREQEEIERERVQYAQIDWHDFVVVETVDYQLNEQGIFPPPTIPEQVGSRIIIQQRIEEQNANEMDVESDDEKDNKKEEATEKDEDKDREVMPPPAPLPPLPLNFENVVIRKDYDPKSSKKPSSVSSSSAKDNWVISPITKEKIPAEKLAEHMRYGLLDPRWLEQRGKAIQEKLQQEEVYAPGVAIESSLKQMAERRTDIFGSGIDETEIGKKIGEEEVKKSDKVTWDGFSSSMEAATRAARANITIEDQIQQIHKIKGLVEEDNKDKIGPALVPSNSQSSNNLNKLGINTVNINQANHNTQRLYMQQNINLPPSAVQQSRLHQNSHSLQSNLISHSINPINSHHNINNPHLNPNQFSMNNSMVLGLYPMHPMHPNLIQTPQVNQNNLPNQLGNLQFMAGHQQSGLMMDDLLEPASKKLRTEENLISEEEFLASHSGTLTLNINVPNMPEKPELRMNGQNLSITFNLTDMVSVIKSKINEKIGLAPGKQKLQYEGIFIKDSNTLAYYNMLDGSVIQLALKERGGRKK